MLIHIITSLESGGAQRVLYAFLKQSSLSEKQIIFFMKGSPFFKEHFNELGLGVYKLNSIKNIILLLKLAWRQTSIVKAWMYHACVVSVLLKLIKPRLRIVWSIHHGQVEKNDSFSTKIFSWFAAYFSYIIPSTVIYPSRFCKKNHIKYGFNNKGTQVIFNPVNYPFLVVLGKDKVFRGKVIGFCARNHPNKRYDLFLKAAISFCKVNTLVEFIICGAGTDNKEVLSLIKKNKLESRFTFLGEINDVSNFYQKIDVFCSLSSTESFGLTVVEAYASKCNVVCTDLDVFREIFKDKVSYVDRPTIESVINAWELAFISPPLEVDSVFLKNFSVQNFYEKYSDVIFECT